MQDTIVDVDTLKAAVHRACRAPSLHNSQPWRWVADGAGLQLFADRSRRLAATDTSGREALIACGAALDHLRVAMAAAGWTAHVLRFPNPNDLDHLASIDFSRIGFVTDGHRRRADAILRRRTDRLPLAEPTNWQTVETLLGSAFDADAAHLDVIRDDLRPRLAEASRLTESLRLYDSSYHAELAWWTDSFGVSLFDGIPEDALVSATEGDRVDVGRSFPDAHPSDRRPGARDHSKVLVLSTDSDSRDDVLRCGEVLSAVLLECTLAGLATCTLTHVTEVPSSRELVGRLTGRAAMPQALIRVGVAPILGDVPPMTPRRPLHDVLQCSD